MLAIAYVLTAIFTTATVTGLSAAVYFTVQNDRDNQMLAGYREAQRLDVWETENIAAWPNPFADYQA